MSTTGQAVGGVVGAIVGFFVPAIGPAYGAQIGMTTDALITVQTPAQTYDDQVERNEHRERLR